MDHGTLQMGYGVWGGVGMLTFMVHGSWYAAHGVWGDTICHGLHVSLELKTTVAESSWKIGEEGIALERWTKKALIFQKLVC